MNGNFMEDYRNKMLCMDWDLLTMLTLCYGFAMLVSALGLCVVEFIMDTTFTPLFMLKISAIIGIFIFVIFLFILYLKCWDFEKKNLDKKSAPFTFKQFKDWYALSPERIIFHSENGCFYFLFDGKNRDMTEFVDYIDDNLYGECTLMYPKTVWDSIQMECFTDKLYMDLKKQKVRKAKIKAEKQSNEGLMKVLNCLQKDVEDVLRDSQNKLNEETEKLNKYA